MLSCPPQPVLEGKETLLQAWRNAQRDSQLTVEQARQASLLAIHSWLLWAEEYEAADAIGQACGLARFCVTQAAPAGSAAQ